MEYTDACVYPLPNGDSSLRRMAIEARDLGFDSIVAACVEGGSYRGVEIVGGILARAKEIREIQAIARKSTSSPALLMASAGPYSLNRALIQTGGVRVIREIQTTPKNSFDHILSRIAAERQVAVDLDLSLIVRERGYLRQKVLQRYSDIVLLHEKFGFPLTISSGARSILEMKSRRDMVALCSIFGLDRDGTLAALGSVNRVLNRQKPVEVVG